MASYQSNQCCYAKRDWRQEGSPSLSLGGQAAASPPGGHCLACGSNAAVDTGLTLRLPGSVQDPGPTPALSTGYPKPPPDRRPASARQRGWYAHQTVLFKIGG